jgi:hypothetical protein
MLEQSRKPQVATPQPTVRHDWIGAKPAKHFAHVDEPVEHEELVSVS